MSASLFNELQEILMLTQKCSSNLTIVQHNVVVSTFNIHTNIKGDQAPLNYFFVFSVHVF